jgi:predicted esterase
MNSKLFFTLALTIGPLWPPSCFSSRPGTTLAHDSASAPASRSGRSAETVGGPVRIEVLDPAARPATFVMRGRSGPGRLVFLHGMCGHGLGYAQSFQFSAAKHGTLIAPQADIVCGAGPWAKWSGKLEELDQRIQSAFRALGHRDPIDDIVIMGYSQGATRAEELARRWPERYTRLVLMGGPKAPSARGLSSVRAAVTMAGERDRRDLMKAGAQALKAAGIPATFMLIPMATHGAMGPTPEQTMGEALDWLFEHSR